MPLDRVRPSTPGFTCTRAPVHWHWLWPLALVLNPTSFPFSYLVNNHHDYLAVLRATVLGACKFSTSTTPRTRHLHQPR